MRSLFFRAVPVVGLLCSILAQPLLAATAQADVRANVVTPVTVCGSLEDECSRYGVKMSATRPEEIGSLNTVVKFDIVGARNKGCSIVLPRTLDLRDSRGHKIAVCSLASIMGQSRPDSDVVGVVITAQMDPLSPKAESCAAEFDVIVAYD